MSNFVSGLIGVGVGALLSAFIQWVTHRYDKRKRRQHLILLVCSILDDFCVDCREAMEEEGDEYTVHRGPLVPSPTSPAFPTEIDWTTIDQDLVRRILWLRHTVPKAERHLEHVWSEWANPPDYKEWFAFRRERCSEWLQEATELSAALRKKANPPIWAADTERFDT